MAKKKESIKEYGADLEKQHKDAKAKLVAIENKIRKRAKFLLKQQPKFKIGHSTARGLLSFIDDFSAEILLDIVKQMEEDYVSKTKQTDLFDGKKKF